MIPENALQLIEPQSEAEIAIEATANNLALALNFDLANAILERVDNDLIFLFDNNGVIVIKNFYTEYTAENMPDFYIGEDIIPGEEFFSAFDTTLMPAAGPEAAEPITDGGRFTESANTLFAEGVDSLGGIDGGSNYTIAGQVESTLPIELVTETATLDPLPIPPINPEAPTNPVPPIIPPAQQPDPSEPATATNFIEQVVGQHSYSSAIDWEYEPATNLNSFIDDKGETYSLNGNVLNIDQNGELAKEIGQLAPNEILTRFITYMGEDGNLHRLEVAFTGNNFNADSITIDTLGKNDVFAENLYQLDFEDANQEYLISNNGVVDTGIADDYAILTKIVGGVLLAGEGDDTIIINNMEGDQYALEKNFVNNGQNQLKNDPTGANLDMVVNLGLGKDNVQLTGEMTAGYIGGDAQNLSKNQMGNEDIFYIEKMNAGGNINGGSDNIGAHNSGSVGGDAAYDMNLNAKGGADIITINKMVSGLVGGDAGHSLYSTSQGGNDTITINTMLGGYVGGDAGRQLSNMTEGGDDTITVTNMADGFVAGDAAWSMNINAQGGEDTIHIGNLSGGQVFGDAQNIKENAQSGNDMITIDTMTNGKVYGDGIYSNNSTDQGGDDTIQINNLSGGFIDGGRGKDTFIYNNEEGHKLTLNDNMEINIENININSEISGITIRNFENLGGGSGDDILIGNKSSNILTGGEGNDIFLWNNTNVGSVDTIADFDKDSDMLDLTNFDLKNSSEYRLTVDYDQENGHSTLTLAHENETLQQIILADVKISQDELDNMLSTNTGFIIV